MCQALTGVSFSGERLPVGDVTEPEVELPTRRPLLLMALREERSPLLSGAVPANAPPAWTNPRYWLLVEPMPAMVPALLMAVPGRQSER